MDVMALSALWQARQAKVPRAPKQRRVWSFLLFWIIGVDLAMLALWAGWTCGHQVVSTDPRLLGMRLWRVPLSLGLAGALWEGGCVVSPRPLRPFFVRARTLLLAELMLGLTTPVKRALFGLGLLFALGLGLSHPILAPWGLLVATLAILWMACLERILPALFPSGLLRQRVLLLLLLAVAGVLAGLRVTGLAAPHLSGQRPAWVAQLEWVGTLPGQHLAQGASELLVGRGEAFGRHLVVPLGATLLLLVLAAWMVHRELESGPAPASGLGGGHPWAFRRPWFGVARLHLQRLLASRAGQLRLFMAFMSILAAKEPELISLGRLQAPRAWVALSAAFVFGAILMVPLCNLLGMERGGIRTHWNLPMEDRDLLRGMLVGAGAYAAMAGGLILLLLGAVHPLRPAELLGIGLLLVAIFLWCAGSGLSHSLRSAWGMSSESYGIQVELTDEKLARLGVVIAPLLWMLPIFALSVLRGPGWLLPCMVGLVLIAAQRIRSRLDAACEELVRDRETITASLVRAS
jgi:hypothetical protein